MAVGRIMLNAEQLYQLAQKLKYSADEMQGRVRQLSSAYHSIEWEIGASGRVNAKASDAESLGNQLSDQLKELGTFVETSARMLAEADSQTGARLNQLAKYNPKSYLGEKLLIGGSLLGATAIPVVNINWISKCIPKRSLEEIIGSARSKKLEEFKKIFPEKTVYAGKYKGQQCKGFVRQFYEDEYGISLPPTKKLPNPEYELDLNASSKVSSVGQVAMDANSESIDSNRIKDLFTKARSGDVVQMVGKSGQKISLHSAIFDRVDGDGNIWFYDANFSSQTNLIQSRKMSYEAFANYLSCAGGGVTVYTIGTTSKG